MKVLVFAFGILAAPIIIFNLIFHFGAFLDGYTLDLFVSDGLPLLFWLIINFITIYGLETSKRWVYLLAGLQLLLFLVGAFLFAWDRDLAPIIFSILIILLCMKGLRLLYLDYIKQRVEQLPHV